MTSPSRRGAVALVAAVLVFVTASCQSPEQSSPTRGKTYVALGDSAVAGAGIGKTTGPCLRSKVNYPSLIAKSFGLSSRDYVDRSCPGASTADVLKGRSRKPALPPQVDALGPDTRVVTVSIGGNDVGYIPGLFTYCYLPPTQSAAACGKTVAVLPSALPTIKANVTRVLVEIRRRAPHAQVVLVSYLRLMPDDGVCDAAVVPGAPADLAAGAVAEGQLDATMRAAAQTAKTDFVSMRTLSADHSACAGEGEAWASGMTAAPGDGSPLHPRALGMAAVARAVEPVVKARMDGAE